MKFIPGICKSNGKNYKKDNNDQMGYI